MSKQIARLLARRRKELGITKAEAARRCGVNWDRWNEWETAKHPPKNLDRVLKALNIKSIHHR